MGVCFYHLKNVDINEMPGATHYNYWNDADSKCVQRHFRSTVSNCLHIYGALLLQKLKTIIKMYFALENVYFKTKNWTIKTCIKWNNKPKKPELCFKIIWSTNITNVKM